MKALIDRAGFVAKQQDSSGGKWGRRDRGTQVRGIHAFDTLNHFFFINQMMVPFIVQELSA